MEIGYMGAGSGIQGMDAFGTMQTAKKSEEQKLASGDSVSISEEAHNLYAEMSANGAEAEENAALDTQAGLDENAQYVAEQGQNVGEGQGAKSQGDAASQGKGGGGGGGGGGGSSSDSSDSTDTLTSIQAEMDAIEMQIAAAEAEAGEGKSNAKIEALEAQLAELQTEYDELADA